MEYNLVKIKRKMCFALFYNYQYNLVELLI